jgi:hypothetical protein
MIAQLRPRRDQNAQRVFQSSVLSDWFKFQNFIFLKISRFGGIEYFGFGLWKDAMIFLFMHRTFWWVGRCNAHFNPRSSVRVPLCTTAWLWARLTWNAPKSLLIEWWLIDFMYKSLVSLRYLSFKWLNILVGDFGWMQRSLHLSIEIFGELARCNARFNPGICIGVPSALTHRRGPWWCWKSVNTLLISYTSLAH